MTPPPTPPTPAPSSPEVAALVQRAVEKAIALEIAHNVVALAIKNILDSERMAVRRAKPASPAAALLARAKAWVPRRKPKSPPAPAPAPRRAERDGRERGPAPLAKAGPAADAKAPDAKPSPKRAAAKFGSQVKAIFKGGLSAAPLHPGKRSPAASDSGADASDTGAPRQMPRPPARRPPRRSVPLGERLGLALKKVFACGTCAHQLPLL
ncbi:hypothetical protein Rsub_01568 [Raphidocelis subcapitata]|uniref:Uncharacterized protein n=1 Tax=Raphidocelis subcapitata TaxID=307507 RepID=A0A2V0NN95_9CHLO|nr:hypothetical protein Rsub_01568 [Raphidocelis subcapitata]|eukprot:GBF88669.1 hypothetical protein Rsub_01568 [Raphidocelis subcapitata]